MNPTSLPCTRIFPFFLIALALVPARAEPLESVISITASTPSGAIDLTALGSLDWAQFGHAGTEGPRVSKASGSELGPLTASGPLPSTSYTDGRMAASYSWADGAPVASASARHDSIAVGPAGAWMRFSVSAVFEPRVLHVHTGGWNAGSRLRASLSDGSAASVEIEQVHTSTLSQNWRAHRIRFRAATPGATLDVEFLQTSGEGNIKLVALALQPEPAPPAPRISTTFNSASIYWIPPARSDRNRCRVWHRPAGSGAPWREAQDLDYLPWNGGEYSGSVVGLAAGLAHEFRLRLDSGETVVASASTASETFPVARVVTLDSSHSTPFVISSGGSAETGYVVYQAAPGGSVIDVANAHDYAVEINADHVVLRGVTVRGGRIGNVRVQTDRRRVVIEDNDLSDWGRHDRDGFGMRADAAIQTDRGGDFVIQGNRIHTPRWDANCWNEPNGYAPSADGRYYPVGAAAIAVHNLAGPAIVRANDIEGVSPGHRIMDAVQVFSYNASVATRDGADIHGNRLVNFTDDGFEIEGLARNTRVWGNYLDQSYTAVSARTVYAGPVYVWRNVANRFVETFQSKFGKTGNQDANRTAGPQYWYHNTMLDAPPGARAFQGIWYQHGTMSPARRLVARNNLFHGTPGQSALALEDSPAAIVFTRNLVYGPLPAGVAPGANLIGEPLFAAGHGSAALDTGRYSLADGAPGHDAGESLPNFNDDSLGAAPDLGAHERGAPRLLYGRELLARIRAGDVDAGGAGLPAHALTPSQPARNSAAPPTLR